MPRGLSPVNVHARSSFSPSYSAVALDAFNPWPQDSYAKRHFLGVDGPLLHDLVEEPLEPCAKRQRLIADRSQPLVHLPVKPQARLQSEEAYMQTMKRRRLQDPKEFEPEERKSEASVQIEELEDQSQALALVPSEASATASHRAAGCLGLESQSPAAIFNCIRDAFSSSSWEPTIQPTFPRPWIFDNEDGVELDNLIIFKDGKCSADQVCLWPRRQELKSIKLDSEVEEPSLPGLIIYNENCPMASTPRQRYPLKDPGHSVVIEEIDEVPMDTSETCY